MKIKPSLCLLALGTVLTVGAGWAQTTPTGTATSTTYPQGAVATDSASAKSSPSQKRAMRRTRKMTNQNARTGGSSTNGSSQDARYRQSSASEGTAVNNSNTTNYNSNNVTNAPTGVGSNPNASGTTTASPTPAGQMNTGQTNRATPSSPGSSATPGTPDSNAGTAAAISGAKTSETPAVKAGSTVRNTSIGDFVSSSPNYTTLQNALQSADLWETLKGTGPYTIFAPTNTAFKKLSATAQGALLEGSNRTALKQLLAYHVVNGSLTADELTRQIKAGNGKAQIKTLSGAMLTVRETNGRLTVIDERSNQAIVETPASSQSNGIVYGISNVLMPKMGVDAFR